MKAKIDHSSVISNISFSKKKLRDKRTLSVNMKAFLVFIGMIFATSVIWETVVRMGFVSSLVPAPTQVIVSGYETLKDPFYNYGVNDVGIGLHLLSSLQRELTGFLLASLIAVPLGFLIGTSEVVSKAIDPIVQILRPVSPLAWLPIGLATLQDSESTAIFVILISSLWPILLNTIFGVRNISPIYLNVARTLETNRWMVIRYILLPASLPNIITGLRVSMGVAWLVIIAAEMLIGGRGIGYFVWNEWNNLNISNIIVCILVIGLVGIGLDRLLGILEKRFSYDG
ncbi:nitrate ABC transporter permease [Bacillus benzoevorans]|uniref:Nitrate/nitrite transport system permease protein n=1 Tax=Bacillus benzoevorans TaxID=1456 RepID=A0A7X0HSZ5_9BACI|nr:nitrate ABC transporter permease [Bacillus benzoevorans]MBB6446284.1 nitrate/nitrite transport system permease protein [Bacillus benzoevorans]